MKQTINFYDFERAFADHGRSEQFTYDGLQVLFDFLEEMESDTGTESELDVIGLCCDFCEDTWQGIAENYSIDLEACDDDDEREQAVLDYLNENTMVAGTTDGSIVYSAF